MGKRRNALRSKSHEGAGLTEASPLGKTSMKSPQQSPATISARPPGIVRERAFPLSAEQQAVAAEIDIPCLEEGAVEVDWRVRRQELSVDGIRSHQPRANEVTALRRQSDVVWLKYF